MAADTGPQAHANMLHPDSRDGFFKTLPRELRDNIYDMLYQEVTHSIGRAPTRAPVRQVRVPLVTRRLVSRQCKLEYDERVAEKEHLTALTINDIGGFPRKKFEFPPIYTHTTNMTIYLCVCRGTHRDSPHPCRHVGRLYEYAEWIEAIARHLPCLHSIRLSLAVVYDQCMDGLVRSLHNITAMPEVVEVKVRDVGFSQALWYLEREKPAVAVWTEQNGLVRDHEVIKRCRERGRWDGRFSSL